MKILSNKKKIGCSGSFFYLIFFNKGPVKYVGKKKLDDSDHDSDEADDEYTEEIITKSKDKAVGRTSVSAEVYGAFNKKEDYKPKVVPKTNDQKKRLEGRLNQAFMFSCLDEKEKEIVIGAMEECKFK